MKYLKYFLWVVLSATCGEATDNLSPALLGRDGEDPSLAQLCPVAERLAAPQSHRARTIVRGFFQRYNFTSPLWHCEGFERDRPDKDGYTKVYTLRGTGELMDARFLHKRELSGFQPQISVYEGCRTSDVAISTARTHSEHASPCVHWHYKDRVTWKTEPEQTYIILVFYQYFRAQGNPFVLRISALPSAEACDRVEWLGFARTQTPISLLENTTNEVMISDLPKCFNDLDSPTAIRSFQVAQSDVMVTVRAKGLGQVTLYEHPPGQCANAALVAQERTAPRGEWQCAAAAPHIWPDAKASQSLKDVVIFHNRRANAKYLLAVNTGGQEFATGTFQLDISATEHNICESAVRLETTPNEVTELQATLAPQPTFNLTFSTAGDVSHPFQLFTYRGDGGLLAIQASSTAFKLSMKEIWFHDNDGNGDRPCWPLQVDFGSPEYLTANLVIPTIPEQTHFIGLAGDPRSEDVISEHYTLTTNILRPGVTCEAETDLGMIGPGPFLSYTDSLSDGYIYETDRDEFECRRGPAKLYTVSAPIAGSISVSVEFITPLETNRFKFIEAGFVEHCDFLRCDERSTSRIEVDQILHIMVWGSMGIEGAQPFRLMVRMDIGDHMCSYWVPTYLGEISAETTLTYKGQFGGEPGTSQTQAMLRSECNMAKRAQLYSFNVSADETFNLTSRILSYNDLGYMRHSIYHPANGTCENPMFKCQISASWEASSSTHLLVVTSHGNTEEDFYIEIRPTCDWPCNKNRPEQSLCDFATDIEFPGDSIVIDGATNGGPLLEIGIACSPYYLNVPAVAKAYSFLGNGRELILSGRPKQTHWFYMTVLEGDCASPTSLATPNAELQSRIRSIAGNQYYVTLSACEANGKELNFELTVISGSDLCVEDKPLGSIGEEGIKLHGTSDSALPFFDLLPCNDRQLKPTLVYTVQGNGHAFRATLLSSADPTTFLSVGYGNCTHVTCFPISGAEVSWTTIPSVTYFLSIVGNNPSHMGGFDLLVEPIPFLADCGRSSEDIPTFPREALWLPGTINKSSTAVLETLVKDCPVEYILSPGGTSYAAQAFTFKGNGGRYYFHLPDDSYLKGVVLTGSCGNTTCVSPFSGNEFSFNVTTVSDEIYTILVQYCCEVSRTGNFSLGIFPLEQGNLQTDAVNLVVEPGEPLGIVGSTTHGMHYRELGRCNTPVVGPTNLYHVSGINGTLMASLVEFDGNKPYISVYSVSEDSTLSCVGVYNDELSHATWRAQEGETFMVAVYACCNFLDISSHYLQFDWTPFQSSCEAIIDLGTATSLNVFSGSSSLGEIGQTSWFSSCREYLPYHGESVVVHKIRGNGEEIHASVYSSRARSTGARLGWFAGNCTVPTCPSVDTSFNYFEHSWQSLYGEDYYLAVYIEKGDYFLTVESESSGTSVPTKADAVIYPPMESPTAIPTFSWALVPSVHPADGFHSESPMSPLLSTGPPTISPTPRQVMIFPTVSPLSDPESQSPTSIQQSTITTTPPTTLPTPSWSTIPTGAPGDHIRSQSPISPLPSKSSPTAPPTPSWIALPEIRPMHDPKSPPPTSSQLLVTTSSEVERDMEILQDQSMPGEEIIFSPTQPTDTWSAASCLQSSFLVVLTALWY